MEVLTDTGQIGDMLIATSADGVAWQRVSAQPFFANGRVGTWDSRWTEGPVLLRTRRGWRMYYMGLGPGRRMQVGLATEGPARRR